MAFRFNDERAVNSGEFANLSNYENSGYITANQIDKIIEQVSSYSSDNGYGNFSFDDMKNNINLQVYGV